jgi:hypothetical protein
MSYKDIDKISARRHKIGKQIDRLFEHYGGDYRIAIPPDRFSFLVNDKELHMKSEELSLRELLELCDDIIEIKTDWKYIHVIRSWVT